jgi:hypothetical protein
LNVKCLLFASTLGLVGVIDHVLDDQRIGLVIINRGALGGGIWRKFRKPCVRKYRVDIIQDT